MTVVATAHRRPSQIDDPGGTMLDELRAIEADFEALAEHLAGLIELYEKDPNLNEHVEKLRAARVKAIEGAERVRQNRNGQS